MVPGIATPFFGSLPEMQRLGLGNGIIHTLLHMGFWVKKSATSKMPRGEMGKEEVKMQPSSLCAGMVVGMLMSSCHLEVQSGSCGGHREWSDFVMSGPVPRRHWWLPGFVTHGPRLAHFPAWGRGCCFPASHFHFLFLLGVTPGRPV